MKIGVIGVGKMGLSYLIEATQYGDVSCFDTDMHQIENINNRIISHNNPFSHTKPASGTGCIITCRTFSQFLNQQNDLIIIATHKETHTEYALAAMAAGSHCLVEKPMCAEFYQATLLLEMSKRLNRKLYIGFSLHGTPAFIALKRLILANKGNIKYFHVDRLGVVPENYPVMVSTDFDLACHDVDFSLQSFGEPASIIRTRTSNRQSEIILKYPEFDVKITGNYPIHHEPEFQYTFSLLLKDGKQYHFDSNTPNEISCSNKKDSVKLETDAFFCAAILRQVIENIHEDDAHYTAHPLSIIHGYHCVRLLKC